LERSDIYEIGNRIVNFACIGKRSKRIVTGAEVIQAKAKYFNYQTRDLNSLTLDLVDAMHSSHSVNITPFEHYEKVIPLLAKYMASINAKDYEIHGLICAIPLNLAG